MAENHTHLQNSKILFGNLYFRPKSTLFWVKNKKLKKCHFCRKSHPTYCYFRYPFTWLNTKPDNSDLIFMCVITIPTLRVKPSKPTCGPPYSRVKMDPVSKKELLSLKLIFHMFYIIFSMYIIFPPNVCLSVQLVNNAHHRKLAPSFVYFIIHVYTRRTIKKENLYFSNFLFKVSLFTKNCIVQTCLGWSEKWMLIFVLHNVFKNIWIFAPKIKLQLMRKNSNIWKYQFSR